MPNMLPNNTIDWTDADWTEFRTWLKGMLAVEKVTVVFTKKDGSERTMVCSTKPDLIPQVLPESKDTKRQKKENMDTLSVYDLEKMDWRSFTLKSIKSISFTL